MKQLRIGIEINNLSYTPESYAYADYLKKKGHIVQLAEADMLYESNDINILYMGFSPFWRKTKTSNAKIIHEYQSLSIGPFARLKNLLKYFINSKPDARIFLNKTVHTELGFNDKIPYIYRDMGIDKDIFSLQYNEQQNTKKEYDIVYSGSVSHRPGLLEAILKLAALKYSILIIGYVSELEKALLSKQSNIYYAGKVSRTELPELYQKASYGLNYTPNKYPFNIQTSTKTLEYCAAGLKVISNKYYWSEHFVKERNASFLWVDNILTRQDIESFNFRTPNVTDLKWEIILEDAQYNKFILDISTRTNRNQ